MHRLFHANYTFENLLACCSRVTPFLNRFEVFFCLPFLRATFKKRKQNVNFTNLFVLFLLTSCANTKLFHYDYIAQRSAQHVLTQSSTRKKSMCVFDLFEL